MGLQDWAVRGAYGRASKRARERACGWDSNVWKRGSLAGHIETHSCRESRVREILRPVLRAIFQLVLRPFLRAALRNRGFRGFERAGRRG